MPNAKYLQRIKSAKYRNVCFACGNILDTKSKTRCSSCLSKNLICRQKYYNKYREQINESLRLRRLEWRNQVIQRYGPICKCCGESNPAFLQVDHINNDGAQHRRKIGPDILKWLVKNKFPMGFQILCANCNWAKHFNGGCPHVRS